MADYTLLHGDIFPFPTIKTHYNKCPAIEEGLNNIFNSKDVYRKPLSITSCEAPGALLNILAIPNIDELIYWIKQCILDNATHFNKPNAKTVILTNGWANRLFKGFTYNCHFHHPDSDGCVIFYQDVPIIEASDLVLVRGGNDETPLTSYEKKDCFRIKVKTGDLIIHHSSIPHGISKHKSDNPRTCIIFNFKLN